MDWRPRHAGLTSLPMLGRLGTISVIFALALTSRVSAASQGDSLVATALEAYANSSVDCYYRPEVSQTLEQLESLYAPRAGGDWDELRAEARRQLVVALNLEALSSKHPYDLGKKQKCDVYGPMIGQALVLSLAVLRPDPVIAAESKRLMHGGARLGTAPPLRPPPSGEASLEASPQDGEDEPPEPPQIELACPEASDFDRTSRSAQQFMKELNNAHPDIKEVSTAMDLWSGVLVAHGCFVPAKKGSFFELPSRFRGRWSTSVEGGKCGAWDHTTVTDDTLLMHDESRCGVAHAFATSQPDTIDVVLFCADKHHLYNLNSRWSVRSIQNQKSFSEQYGSSGNVTTAQECSG